MYDVTQGLLGKRAGSPVIIYTADDKYLANYGVNTQKFLQNAATALTAKLNGQQSLPFNVPLKVCIVYLCIGSVWGNGAFPAVFKYPITDTTQPGLHHQFEQFRSDHKLAVSALDILHHLSSPRQIR